MNHYMKSKRLLVKPGPEKDRLEKELSSSHYSKKKLGVNVVENGRILISRNWLDGGILEGGIVDVQNRFISSSSYVDNGGCPYDFDNKSIDYQNKTCVYLGLFAMAYGHAITDSLKRLWFLNTVEGKQMIEDSSIDFIFITERNLDLPSWYCKILELAGVELSKLKHIRVITQYRRIWIPDNSLFNDAGRLYYCDEFRSVIEKIKHSVQTTDVFNQIPSLKIYFTRARLGLNNILREIGESRIERLFMRNGYQIISPEKLSIEEQISILMKCKAFASTEGSCSHAAIFCRKEASIIVLRKADYINLYSSLISDMTGSETTFIDANHSSKIDNNVPMFGPFYLYITPQLRQFAQNKSFSLPYYLHPYYWFYLTLHTRIGRNCAKLLKKTIAIHNSRESIVVRI